MKLNVIKMNRTVNFELYNSSMRSTICHLSPQQRLLHYEEFSPTKLQVQCDINGWFQTNKKTPTPGKRKLPKYIHSRFNANKKLKENIFPSKDIIQLPNNSHLLSITKLKNQIELLSTKGNTLTSKSISTKKNNRNQIALIDINPFDSGIGSKAVAKKKGKVLPRFLQMYSRKSCQLEQLDAGLFSDRTQERKKRAGKILSFNKIRNMGKQSLQSHVKSRKISLVDRSNQLMNENSQTSLRGALKMIVNHRGFRFINNSGEAQNPSIDYQNDNIRKRKKGSVKLVIK